jgi:hypothetical protein
VWTSGRLSRNRADQNRPARRPRDRSDPHAEVSAIVVIAISVICSSPCALVQGVTPNLRQVAIDIARQFPRCGALEVHSLARIWADAGSSNGGRTTIRRVLTPSHQLTGPVRRIEQNRSPIELAHWRIDVYVRDRGQFAFRLISRSAPGCRSPRARSTSTTSYEARIFLQEQGSFSEFVLGVNMIM